jgi:hypothetical protein
VFQAADIVWIGYRKDRTRSAPTIVDSS